MTDLVMRLGDERGKYMADIIKERRLAADEIERLRKALDEHHVYTEWEARDGVLYVLCAVCGHAKPVESHDQVREALGDDD